MKRLLRTMGLWSSLGAFALASQESDGINITGVWIGTSPGPSAQDPTVIVEDGFTRVYRLVQDGEKLSGTITGISQYMSAHHYSQPAPVLIEDGTVQGNEVYFAWPVPILGKGHKCSTHGVVNEDGILFTDDADVESNAKPYLMRRLVPQECGGGHEGETSLDMASGNTKPSGTSNATHEDAAPLVQHHALPSLVMDDTGAVLGIKELWLEGRCYDMEFRFAQLVHVYGELWRPDSPKPPFWNPDLDSAYGDASVISQEERSAVACRFSTPILDALNGKNTQGISPGELKHAGGGIPVYTSSYFYIPVYARVDIDHPHAPLVRVTFMAISRKGDAWVCDLVSKMHTPNQGRGSMFILFLPSSGISAENDD